MAYEPEDYWKECISSSAQECGLVLTSEQLKCLAKDIEIGHENYGMAFYSPPASDRLNEIEREYQNKIKKIESEFNKYRKNAEEAVKIALNQNPDTNISIGEYGEVTRWGGRVTQIQ